MLTLCLAALLTRNEPVSVTPPSFRDAREPEIAVDSDRRVYIAYGLGDAIYLSTSSDEAASFTPPTKIAEAGKISLGMRRGPRIVAFNGTLTVTATYGRQGGGKDGDLLAWRSKDQGKTWSGPSRVNDVESSDREGLHAMAISPTGIVACAWLDLRTKGTKIYMSSSSDGGASWAANRLVYASPSGTVCQCCHPSLAFDPKGRLYVMFRNVIDGARDLYLTSTDDLGATFSPAQKLGTGTWMLDACPMDGGALAVDAQGSVHTIWRREDSIFSCMPAIPEARLAEGHDPWAASSARGINTVWVTSGHLWLQTAETQPTELATNADDPVIASDPSRKLVVAAWTSGGVKAIRLPEE